MIQKETEESSVAYQSGWIDGRHGGGGFFTENPDWPSGRGLRTGSPTTWATAKAGKPAAWPM